MARTTKLERGQCWIDNNCRVHCAECGRKGMVKARAIWAWGYTHTCDKCGKGLEIVKSSYPNA